MSCRAPCFSLTVCSFVNALVLVYELQLSVQDVKSAGWHTAFGGSKKESDEKLLDFYHSPHFSTKVDAVATVQDVLKPLRKYFYFIAVTDRPRIVEKQTREWLDVHFAGVFDKLVFVDEDTGDDVIPRKKELYDDFKVKIAVGSDPIILPKAAEDVGHAVLVGSVPWAKATTALKSTQLAADWNEAKDVFEKIIAEMDLKPTEFVYSGPKLSKYTDDLVTVSTRKPAGLLHHDFLDLLYDLT